jgi:hypothetical protein
MQEAAELGLWKWLIEHVAVPLLSGLWAALAWWIQLIANRFQKLEERHAADTMAINAKIAALDREHTETYARRDDLREGMAHMREDMHAGFANVEKKLDTLMRHALKDSQG